MKKSILFIGLLIVSLIITFTLSANFEKKNVVVSFSTMSCYDFRIQCKNKSGSWGQSFVETVKASGLSEAKQKVGARHPGCKINIKKNSYKCD